jgi:hypothetical protein
MAEQQPAAAGDEKKYLWGAPAIARAIGCRPRKIYDMHAKGALRGVRQLPGCRTLVAHLETLHAGLRGDV